MSKTSWSAGGALILGLTLGVILTRSNDAAPMMPLAQSASAGPSLQREELEGDDVAKLLQLNAYKWRYALPSASKSRPIWATLWVEDWHRGGLQPKIYDLGVFNVMQLQGTFMLKTPRTTEDPCIFVSNGSTTGSKILGFAPLISNFSGGALDEQPIALEHDLILTHQAHNQSGLYDGDPRTVPNYARQNDRTVFYKVRFTQNANLLEPVWKNGRVELK